MVRDSLTGSRLYGFLLCAEPGASGQKLLEDPNGGPSEYPRSLQYSQAGLTFALQVYVYSMRMDKQSPTTAKRDVNDDTRDAMDMAPPETNASNDTDVEIPQRLDKRAIVEEVGKNWHLSQISFPASSKFDEPVGNHNPNGGDYAYNFDDSLGQGQTFYLMEGGYLPSPGVSWNLVLCTKDSADKSLLV